MKYFKHQSNMRHDTKIKRLIAKFGIEGYGLYNLIVESITENICDDKPLPELLETCEDIATFYNGNTSRINDMAAFMVNQGLFEIDELSGHIFCSKIFKFLEASGTRSEKIRQFIENYRETERLRLSGTNPYTSGTKAELSGTNMTETETETESIDVLTAQQAPEGGKGKSRFVKPTISEIYDFMVSIGFDHKVQAEKFYHHYESKGWIVGRSPMKSWKSAVHNWKARSLEMGTVKKTPAPGPRNMSDYIAAQEEGHAV